MTSTWLHTSGALLAAGLSLIVPGATGAAADSKLTQATCPIVIAESGDYRLETDLVCPAGVDGIVILASNVRLRLDGHRIIGGELPPTCNNSTGIRVGTLPGPMLSGIRVVGPSTIEGFRNGFGAQNTVQSRVMSLTITVECASGSNGIRILPPGGQWRIEENTVRGPADSTAGIGIGRNVDGNVVVRNDVSNTISLVGSSGNTIARNVANEGGILVFGASHDNEIHGNTANNGPFGLGLDIGATGNDVTGNSAFGNSVFDLLDNNPACDSNRWEDNQFGTANQACIH